MRHFLFFALLFTATLSATAQYIIEEQQNYPEGQSIDSEPQFKITATPITLPFSATQPFIDDFSASGQNIDTTKWFLDGTNRQPLKYHHGAILNPTEGVVTFDGVNAKGDSYTTVYASGFTDRLETHYIDLSNRAVSDNIVLSFFLERGGLGDSPEYADAFSVSLRDKAGIWQTPFLRQGHDSLGVGLNESSFRYFDIPIDQDTFFHNHFQIRFEAKGNKNLHIDLWHLDYVYMAMNRTVADSTLNDIAIEDITPPLLLPYTHLPYQQYDTLVNIIQTSAVSVKNLSSNAQNVTLHGQISDPIGNNFFASGNAQTTNPLVAANNIYSENLISFLNQNMPPLNASYLLSTDLQASPDLISQNNHYSELSRIDSVMAYDDGEAEKGFGVTKIGGFGQKFNIASPDYITAIWICFTPIVNYNVPTQSSVYMDQHGFKLAIWDQPDSILYQQDNVKVSYGDSLHQFIRYKLYEPIPVKDTIWVGVLQKDALGLGVGLDINGYNGFPIYWENSAGAWVQANIKGALMVRPEFRNAKFNPLPAPIAIDARNTSENSISIYPNPLTTSELIVNLPHNISHYSCQIYDLQGLLILEKSLANPEEKCTISLPNLPQGCYFVKHNIETPEGKIAVQNDKLWIAK